MKNFYTIILFLITESAVRTITAEQLIQDPPPTTPAGVDGPLTKNQVSIPLTDGSLAGVVGSVLLTALLGVALWLGVAAYLSRPHTFVRRDPNRRNSMLDILADTVHRGMTQQAQKLHLRSNLSRPSPRRPQQQPGRPRQQGSPYKYQARTRPQQQQREDGRPHPDHNQIAVDTRPPGTWRQNQNNLPRPRPRHSTRPPASAWCYSH
ncbi:uncharacterized protein LOC121860004 isoform X2 [Homarus americanus]|uniref:uncharacterized protein LOC121860004 isoform X2 n=1 Tax=Homarus americanus TaxID=6706 RepID=UPI001C47E745|nr:uncharacterized protein LOC121860004 isoform X2 [Homarus americanus]